MDENTPRAEGNARINQIKKDITGPGLAPAVLTLGSLVWRLTSVASNIDFLISLREEKITLIFNFVMAYGWWLFAVIGIVWFIAVRGKAAPTVGLGLVLVVGLLSFMSGMLLAVRATGGVPNVVGSWGPTPTGCNATIDTSKLQSFRDNYKIALVCGLIDPAADIMEDTRITVSPLFTILPVPVAIQVQHRADMVEYMATPNRQMWFFFAVLLPEGTQTSQITRLSDVKRHNGKILREGLFQ